MEKKSVKFFWSYVFILAILVKLYFIYYGYRHGHYLVPPGSDAIEHFKIIRNIIGGNGFNANYPPGFHLLIIFLSKIFNRDAWYFLTYWTPILVILPSLSVYYLLRQLFSQRVSVITASFLLLTSNFPLFAFVDGNYPNMLAYGCFSVLLFAFLIRYYKTENWKNLIWAGIFLILIALTHHFTFASIFSILIIFALTEVILHRNYKAGLWILGSAVLAGILAYLIYGNVINHFITGMINNISAIKDAYLSQPLELGDYPFLAGNLIWYAGAFGLIYLFITPMTEKVGNKAKQLVIIWFFFFFIMSRVSATGLPARFARELALPLVIALGFLLNYLLEQNKLKKPVTMILGYALIAGLIYTNSAFITGIGKLPDSFNRSMWFWPKDQEKLNYLSNNVPTETQILFNPNANLFVPILSNSNLVAFNLSKADIEIAQKFVDDPNSQNKIGYESLLERLKVQYPQQYIFNDVLPPSNPPEEVYAKYKGFKVKQKILEDMIQNAQKTIIFDDKATFSQMF